MKFKDFLQVVLIVAILQGGLGIVLFSLTGGTPGVNLYSIGVSIIILITISSVIGLVLYWLINKYIKERAIKTALMTLSEDEETVLRKIMQNGEIRQDDLRRELKFSKSKLSALVNNLEKKNAIEKNRYKRTNMLKPSEEFQK